MKEIINKQKNLKVNSLSLNPWVNFIPSKSCNYNDYHTPVDNDDEIEKSRRVTRIENVKLAMEDTKFGTTMKWIFGISILVCAWVYSLDSLTTYNYSVYATQFNNHSMISTLGITTSIIAAVMKPILGKFSDLTPLKWKGFHLVFWFDC